MPCVPFGLFELARSDHLWNFLQTSRSYVLSGLAIYDFPYSVIFKMYQ